MKLMQQRYENNIKTFNVNIRIDDKNIRIISGPEIDI